jgi:hypothetical protein
MRFAEDSEFAATSAETDVPLRDAMPESVSPVRTV